MLTEFAPWRLAPIIVTKVPTGPLLGEKDDIDPDGMEKPSNENMVVQMIKIQRCSRCFFM